MKGMLLLLYIPKLCENKALVRKNQSQQYLVDCLAFCQCTGVRRQNDVSGIIFSFCRLTRRTKAWRDIGIQFSVRSSVLPLSTFANTLASNLMFRSATLTSFEIL